MALTLKPTNSSQSPVSAPRILVMGVGGGGGNAVDSMIARGLEGVQFAVANTDAQQLNRSPASIHIQLGPTLTRGLGAGAKPEVGKKAAEEVEDEIRERCKDVDLVFITAGMGGGTGTGAAPVIARLAQESGALTVGVVSEPFDYEGPKKKRAANSGLEELQPHLNTLIVISNQNLNTTTTAVTTLKEAYAMVDEVLYDAVRSITEVIYRDGYMNVDFADVRTILDNGGLAMMGIGRATTEDDGAEDRAVIAAERAIHNSLLKNQSIRGARGLLVNISSGEDMTLSEVTNVMERIRKEAFDEAEIIHGQVTDPEMNGRIEISVIGTGLGANSPKDAVRGGARPNFQLHSSSASTQPHYTPSEAARPQRETKPGFFGRFLRGSTSQSAQQASPEVKKPPENDFAPYPEATPSVTRKAPLPYGKTSGNKRKGPDEDLETPAYLRRPSS